MSKYLVSMFALFCLSSLQARAQDSLSAAAQVVQDTSVFRFAPERRMFWASYKGNEEAIAALSRSLRKNKAAIETGGVKVRVCGFCASYGSYKENLAAAKNRSNQVKSYFIVHEGLKESHFRTTNSTRRWRGQSDVVAIAYLFRDSAGREALSAITESPQAPDTSVPPPDSDTLVRTGPASRSESDTLPEAVSAPAQKAEPEPEAIVTLDTAPVQPASVETQSVEPACAVASRHRWAVKTNVAYLAATVANFGGEFAFGGHYSLDVPVIYSPYTVSRTFRLRFIAVQPEFRYWLGIPMKGHFFGVHLSLGAFNISVDGRTRYQSPDGFYGAGLSYGYAQPLGGRWGAEFTVGAGYVHTKYDAYYNIPNGSRYEQGVSYSYWGLTKVGINLVYKFGK